MKFGRYLEDNLTPEWKRAYIDYRACKKSIKVIANRLAAGDVDAAEQIHKEVDKSSDDEDAGPSAPPRKSPSVGQGGRPGRSPMTPGSRGGRTASVQSNNVSRTTSRRTGMSPTYGAMSTSPRPIGHKPLNPPPLDLGESSYEERSNMKPPPRRDESEREANQRNSHQSQSSEGSKDAQSDDNANAGSESGQHLTSNTFARVKESPNLGRSPRFLHSPRIFGTPKDASNPVAPRRSLRSMTMPSPRPVRAPVSFSDLYDSLEADEQNFFDLLQHELDKVEGFYAARIADAQRRAHDLRDQLRELAEHRRIFHEMYPNGLPEWEAKVGKLLPVTGTGSGFTDMAKNLRKRLPFIEEDHTHASNGNNSHHTNGTGSASADPAHINAQQKTQNLREEMGRDAEHHTYNPERYQKYKRDLRNASLEFYRQLELIKNYRIMNLTGFRKALKKFEKTTKIHCLELYTDEKISKETFAKGKVVDDLLKQMEELYTEHFEHGDTKKARDKLRRQQMEKTHYFSVFRSGICIGLALPPAVLALVKACEKETRDLIPGWDGMLQVYGGFYLAVIFSLLFQLNLDAYVAARINYEFVMELSKPTLDHRSYAEIPAFLFLTLSYCFFFSYYRVAPHSVAPTTWPLAWLVFVCVFFLNPLPILRRRSRYWFLRVLFRVCTPGYSKVEFIAFFLADELNSLVYTMQNFYFMGCAYSHHWPVNTYHTCPSATTWPYAVLLSLPALARLIQCIKRWHDSRLKIHLINAGKYVSSIAQLCLFVLWKGRGRHLHDASFIVWVMVATASSIYTSSWDLIVDWSLLRPKSGLLRPDRGYSSKYVYYFAMVTNVLIRFIWVWYIPTPKIHTNSRSFGFALAEMLRRWQWNFFRVETEHLGNADAYRVTREIPLPYRRIERDSDEEDHTPTRIKSRPGNPITVQLDRLRRELVGGDVDGRGPDEPNLGPRGFARQREYEARRPGDLEVRGEV